MTRAPLRLITIGFSHYCEKARWALDRSELCYREEAHVPMLHWGASLRAGGGRTVPVLVTPEGVLRESTEILEYVDARLAPARRLFPEEGALAAEVRALVADFDRGIGPAVRRWLYWHLLRSRAASVELLASMGPAWERSVVRGVFPVMKALMMRGLQVNPAGAARSMDRMLRTFDAVEARLADGRRYLTGDRFTAADLTYAALAGVLVQPPEYGRPAPQSAGAIPAIAEVIAAVRQRPAGALVLRLFAEQRPPLRGVC